MCVCMCVWCACMRASVCLCVFVKKSNVRRMRQVVLFSLDRKPFKYLLCSANCFTLLCLPASHPSQRDAVVLLHNYSIVQIIVAYAYIHYRSKSVVCNT